MDHQTPMNGNRLDEPTARDVARSAGDLWHHIFVLGELQTRLLAIELAQGVRQARSACVLLVIGGVVALASLPVALACLALVLAETTALSLAGAFAVASVLAVSTACGLIVVGWRQLRKNATGIPQSRDEWRSSWSWLKETFQGPPPSAARARGPANGRA